MDLDELQDETFARATPLTREAYPPERRLTGDALSGYLDRRVFAVIASTRSNGRPHATVGSYVRRGTSFWLPTAGGTVREANVRDRPWVSLVVAEGDRQEHVVVIIEGRVTVVESTQVPVEVRSVVPDDWVSKWLRVDARRVLSYAAESA